MVPDESDDVLDLLDIVEKGTPPEEASSDDDASFEAELNDMFTGGSDDDADSSGEAETPGEENFDLGPLDDLLDEMDGGAPAAPAQAAAPADTAGVSSAALDALEARLQALEEAASNEALTQKITEHLAGLEEKLLATLKGDLDQAVAAAAAQVIREEIAALTEESG